MSLATRVRLALGLTAVMAFTIGLGVGCGQNQTVRDLEDVPATDPDSAELFNNVDGYPNVVRLCIDGVAFATTTREAQAAIFLVPEWDDECEGAETGMSVTNDEAAAIEGQRLWTAAAARHDWRLAIDGGDGQRWEGRGRYSKLQVIWSLAREQDDHLWLHVSVSHENRIPSWVEMCQVKDTFMGEDCWAAQLHPPRTEHINLNPRVLHLWSPFDPDRWPLPDFSRGSGSI